jgi:hypothetical protein
VAYGAPNLKTTTPTQSRLREGTDLLTCCGENNQEKAGKEKVARVPFNGGEGGFRWRSNTGNGSNGGGGGRGSSYRRRIVMGSSGATAQQRWRSMAMVARFCGLKGPAR